MKIIKNFFSQHTLVAFLLMGILFRLFLWLEFTPHCCGSDELTYHSIAKHLVVDQQFLYTRDDDSLLWADRVYGIKPPLYPFFIAVIYKIFGVNPSIVYIFQILLSTITGYLIYRIGKRLSSKRVGIIALIIFSFFWETAHMNLTLMSENLHWLLLAALTAFLLESKLNRNNHFILLGIIFGLIILNRPASLMLLPLITLWLLWKNINFRTFKNLFITYIVFVLILVPWTIRNYKVFGEFVFVYAEGGINVWMGNYPQSGGSYNIPRPNIPGQIPILKNTGAKAEIERDNYYYSKAYEYILSDPIEAIDTDFRKILRTFPLYRPITLNETIPRGQWPLARPKSFAIDEFWELVVSYQFAAVIITFFTALFIKRVDKKARSVLILLIAGHLLVIALSIWTPRYVTHIYPLIIPFSAVFISRLNKVFKSAAY